MPLFHVKPRTLPAGTIIAPGEWWNHIVAYGTTHQHYEHEAVLEHIRATEFRDKPSRQRACFALVTWNAAVWWQVNQSLPGSVIHEVEAVDPSARQHIGEFTLIAPVAGRSETMAEIARFYWSGRLTINVADAPWLIPQELVTESALRIVRAVLPQGTQR